MTNRQHDEFIPTPARDDVGGPTRCPQRPGDREQHFVTSIVTMPVIHFLQTVNVEEGDREPVPGTGRDGKHLLTEHLQPTPIGQAVSGGIQTPSSATRETDSAAVSRLDLRP